MSLSYGFVKLVLNDLRTGWRILAVRPGFTIVAVLSFAHSSQMRAEDGGLHDNVS